jgi:NAD-dependent dihydropyrimidine dehydrogenase PreA subunit
MGRGMGMGVDFPAAAGAPLEQLSGPLSKEDELVILNQQAEALAQQMQQMQDRIRQLEPKGNIGTVTATVDVEKCTGCGICIEVCPVEAIRLDAEVAVIDRDTCTGCGSCVNECPNEAISLA